MNDVLPIHLTVLVDYQDGRYVAHCLETNLVATGPSEGAVVSDMNDLIAAYLDFAIENDNMENFWHPAPPEVWRKLAEIQAKTATCKYKRTSDRAPRGLRPFTNLEMDTVCCAAS